MEQRTAILLKDLPNCPKGRIFKEKIGWDEFYLYQSDEDIKNDTLKWYEFTTEQIDQNPDWFKII